MPEDEMTNASVFIFLILCLMVFSGCSDVGNIAAPQPVEILDIGFIVAGDRLTFPRGAEMAVAEINANGGLLGRPVGLLTRINEAAPLDASLAIAEELIREDKVIALIGPNRSTHAIEVGKLATQYRVPMITTTATNPQVTASGDFVFMAAFTDNFQGAVMARFARVDLDLRRAAVLTRRGDLYTEGISAYFVENFERHGGAVMAHEFYDAETHDFTGQLSRIATTEPDVLFLPGFVEDIVLATAQARAVPLETATGAPTLFLGADTWDNTLLLENENAEIQGSYFSGHFSPETEDPTARAFVETYRSLYNETPTGGVGVCYDAVKIFFAAVQRAGSLDPDVIRQHLAATENYVGATRIAGFNEDRHPTKSVAIFRIHNDEKQFYQQIDP